MSVSEEQKNNKKIVKWKSIVYKNRHQRIK